MSDFVNHMDTDPYEEFYDKYRGLNEYSNPKSHSQALPFINTKFREHGNFYFDVKSLERINDKRYSEIESFPDYDYVNSIAFEMLIRTNEYKKLPYVNTLTQDEKIKSYDKLGITMSEVDNYNFRKVGLFYSENESKQKFFQSYCDITIFDIQDGLSTLIDFYLKRKQIHTLVEQKKDFIGRTTNIQYQVKSDITFEEVMSALSIYYIPSKFDYDDYENKSNMCRLDSKIPLIALTDEFLMHIEQDIPNEIKGKIAFSLTRPLLRFKESAIFDIPINLSLSEESIAELISNLKKEYDDKSIKTPINYLYDKYYETVNWEKSAPFRITKKSMARAFFVYDIYTSINASFVIKKNQLIESRNQEIADIEMMTKEKAKKENENTFKFLENSSAYIKDKKKAIEAIKQGKKKKLIDLEKAKKENENTSKLLKKLSADIKDKNKAIKEIKQGEKKKLIDLKKEKKEKINSIKWKYKEQSLVFDTLDVVVELIKEHQITRYMCKQYMKFMRKYIDDLKYTELIIGNKVKP